MSAPVAVNTADGTCWTRRGEKRDGEALYAPEGVCNCPPFVMATLVELAEHGIVGSADALPVPPGPEPQGERLSIARIAEIQQRVNAATPGPWEEHAAYGENFYAYLGGPYLRGVGTLNFGDGDDAEADKALTVNAREDIRALLSELFTVRAELRVARGRVAELETAADQLSFIERNTLTELHRRIEHHMDGKARWRKRAEAAEARVAELEAAQESPLAFAEKLDAKSLDNFLIALASATEHEPQDAAIARIHELIASYREATAPYKSRPLPPRDAVCARPGCGHPGVEHHHGDTRCWARLPKPLGAPVTNCDCTSFVAETGGDA